MIEKINRSEFANYTDQNFSGMRIEDLNGSKRTFENCDFSASYIARGYFRDAHFNKCMFIGCRITETNFRETRFTQCDFRYTIFDRCLLPVKELISNLPQWPNVRRELIQNLRANVRAVGDFNADHLLLQYELEAERDHWRKARKQEESYYQKKYGSLRDQLRSRFNSAILACDAWFWGHGFSFLRLTTSTVATLLILISALFLDSYCCSDTKTLAQIWNDLRMSASQTLSLYIDLPDVNTDLVKQHWWFSTIVVMLRYVSLGLFITCFYRRLARN